MARGKKARQITHLVCPTSTVSHKKRATAEVRLFDNQAEVVFVGKSRHECFKWCHDQVTEGNYVKVHFIRESYAEFMMNGGIIPAALPKVATSPSGDVEDHDDGGVPADIAGNFDDLQNIADLIEA